MNEELQQHLMEFVYGLLDESQANALCERITSDPQAARAYATVKLQCDLVARAARYDTESVAWTRPDEDTSSHASVQTASRDWSANAYRRLANWCIGVAASGLICLVASSYLVSSLSSRIESTPVALASAKPVRVVLTGPSKLHAEASNPFTIQVENQAGTPVSTTLKYRVYDAQGAVSWQDSMSTDKSGVVRFDVQPALARRASRLEITTADDSPAPILRELEASPDRFATYLRMDRPLYQPGEPVYYRSVTLSQYGLRSDREVTTSFEIVNASDEPLEGSTNITQTEHGVGSGTVVLPNDLPDGTYTLMARSPDNLFREEWRDFHVRRYEAPRLFKKLELAQDSYSIGDRVDLDFSVKRVAGKPLAELPLQIQATLDGLSLATPQVKTDANGDSQFSLTLPESIERGEASVSVTVQEGDNPAETITKDIPINLGKVNVDFYPEGGDLAADVPSRVYFYGRDPLGKPTHIEGRVIDSNDNQITEVVTGHEGRGVFSFTPNSNEHYRLVIEKPVGVTKEVPLPATSPIRFATIETGEGVFDASDPIAFTLYKVYPVEPLIVAAYCRGAMVGQQTLDVEGYSTDNAAFATFHGEIPLPDEAQGVIRLTVFDAISTPPQPIAERLVYRRVGQKLDVQFTPDAETFAPGQAVQLDLAVRDENDAPVPAVLGIAIVDDAVLSLADDKSTRMPTYFHLLTEIDSSEQLEDANFYLSDEPESVAALDSLLGTQGWRRFRDRAMTQLTQAGGGGFGGGGGGLSFRKSGVSSRHRSLAWFEETAVPLSTATTMDVQEITLRQSTRLVRAASSSRQVLALPIIIASIVLLTLVGVASLCWARRNLSLRLFAGAVAVVSLLVGVLSLPMKPIRVSQATDSARPAAGEVGVKLNEQGTMIAADDIVTLSEEADAVQPEGFMSNAGDTRSLSDSDDAPMAAAAIDSQFPGKLKIDPKGTARFAVPEKQLGRGDEAAANENFPNLAPSKEKKESMPPSDARPKSEATATPEQPQPTAEPFSGRTKMREERFQTSADAGDNKSLTREYAKWFFADRSSVPPTDESSSTIFWLPHHLADQTGKATIYFNLPRRASSYRAIVEAHGAGRLGAGELLINSQER